MFGFLVRMNPLNLILCGEIANIVANSYVWPWNTWCKTIWKLLINLCVALKSNDKHSIFLGSQENLIIIQKCSFWLFSIYFRDLPETVCSHSHSHLVRISFTSRSHYVRITEYYYNMRDIVFLFLPAKITTWFYTFVTFCHIYHYFSSVSNTSQKTNFHIWAKGYYKIWLILYSISPLLFRC